MFQKKDYILLGIICLLLGFFIIQQFYLHKKITGVSQPENESNLAIEVSELFKTNNLLKQEVDDLSIQHEKLSQSAQNAKSANDALEEDLTKYQVILGLKNVTGQGIDINFNDKVSSTQMVDLINAIKNIGCEVIAINDQRVVSNTSIGDGYFNSPTKVSVIGDKELLFQALERGGGILEQIGFGTVQKNDNLVIKAK